MSAEPDRRGSPLVLLTGPFASAAGTAALRRELAQLGPVLVPELDTTARRPVDLSVAALAVLAAISGAGADDAALCGIGIGAMVALQVAAAQPRRVSALVLSTATRPVATSVRSLHRGVAGVLPARTLQLLGGGRRQALAALDQVRPLDYGPLVPLVRAPVLVLSGGHDPVNARAGRRLAERLPVATAVTVPDAGPGWMWEDAARYVAAATPFLRRHTGGRR